MASTDLGPPHAESLRSWLQLGDRNGSFCRRHSVVITWWLITLGIIKQNNFVVVVFNSIIESIRVISGWRDKLRDLNVVRALVNMAAPINIVVLIIVIIVIILIIVIAVAIHSAP